MNFGKTALVFAVLFCLAASGYGGPKKTAAKERFVVVSSYHREYLWSQETNIGFCDAMRRAGYFESAEQAEEYSRNDYVETPKVIVKKLWMDAKRRKSRQEKLQATAEITRIIKEFNPTLIFLGDDDAAQYVGNQFLDIKVPMVFWGINNTPVKYGLVDSMERPGHNVTGIYQPGYYRESLILLKKIVPSAKTFAILTDDTTAGRSHYKAIEYLARQNELPLTLVETVITGDYEEFKSRVLDLQTRVDAFFVAQYSSLMDKAGSYVTAYDVAAWYLANVKIPETAEQGQFVKQGMLCGADDSGYNQGYDAVLVAADILSKGVNPAEYPVRAPKRGALMVNLGRAAMLGIPLTDGMGIEKYIDDMDALKHGKR